MKKSERIRSLHRYTDGSQTSFHVHSHRFDQDGLKAGRRHSFRYPENLNSDKVVLLVIVENDTRFHLFGVMDPGIREAHIQGISLWINGSFHGFALSGLYTL